MKMIHVITGAPCSGKSTYVEQNAKEGDLRVDFDKIAECLGASASHSSSGLVRKAAFEARKGAIEKALENPQSESWIIHTFPTKEQIERYKDAGAVFIEMDTDKETCLARAEADGRPQETIDGINKYFAEEKGNKMEHLYKSFELKADENGMVAGYFSTYDKTPDSYGDIIEPGAFTETIKKREESGHPFPLCFNHDFSAVIGAVKTIEDTEKGPYIEAEFLDTAMAQDVRKMLQSGAIYQFSFAYDVLGARQPNEEEKKDGIQNVLTKLEVFEISVVTVPANQNAVATEVKSVEPETKAGRRNSKKDADVIKQIRDLAQSLLDEDDDKPEEETEVVEEAQSEANEKSKEQKDEGNSKRAEDILGKINKFKEATL